MDRSYLRAVREAEISLIASSLQKQQFVQPHQDIICALATVGESVGFCRGAAERSLGWLQIDADQAIGRLRRTELLQLARSIQRFWRQNAHRPDRSSRPIA